MASLTVSIRVTAVDHERAGIVFKLAHEYQLSIVAQTE